jgi:8-oxo-dGTP pyrophosphatase MutT (NUDIX family)
MLDHPWAGRLAPVLERGPEPPLEAELAQAAVAALVAPDGQMLFIRRAQREGDPWSGHMAFPGGRRDPEDPDLVATALRELSEEVGLRLPGPERMLGRLSDVWSPVREGRRALVVRPYLFAVDGPFHAPANDEVAELHWIGLPRLLAREGEGTMPWSWRGQQVELPVLRIGTADIWGMTLRMVDDLCGRLGRG